MLYAISAPSDTFKFHEFPGFLLRAIKCTFDNVIAISQQDVD